MTVAELKRLSPEQKNKLFYEIPESTSSGPINSEKDTIDAVIEQYTNTKIALDDVQILRKELSEIIA